MRLTKIFMAIFALDERLPSSATLMIRTTLFHKVSNGVEKGSWGDDVGEDGYDGSGDADDDNIVSQDLQRGRTRESEAERGSRQEFLQVVNSQRDR